MHANAAFYYHGAPALSAHALAADAAIIAALLLIMAITVAVSVRHRAPRQDS
jgi:hypothetical protein